MDTAFPAQRGALRRERPFRRLRSGLAGALLAAAALPGASAGEGGGEGLRFDPERIVRYSLDHLPRSISIRWGGRGWAGYDLERAKLYKVWRDPEGGAGLRPSGFTVRSAGTALFTDESEESWTLRRGGKSHPLSVRYLGCTDRGDSFELSWELRHEGGACRLVERIAATADGAGTGPERRLRAEGLGKGEALLPPPAAAERWAMIPGDGGGEAAALSGGNWHRVVLR